MRHWLLAMVLAICVGSGAHAQDAEIESVINSQIEAFQADDFAAAFEFAHPSIRSIFRTPENFGRMVTQGYPMVWRPAEVRYLALDEISGQLWQRVEIVDAEGKIHQLAYRMTKTSDGWKISAVQLLESSELST